MTASTDTRARIMLNDEIELLETKPGKWTPYRIYIMEDGRRNACPIRGYNKRGKLQWRTYKNADEARENLGIA